MRKQTIAAVIVGISIMLVFVPFALAGDSYLSFKGGYFSPSSKGGFQNTDLNGNTYWEIAVGLDFARFFGTELSVGYLQPKSDKVDIYSVPVMVSLKAQFPIAIFVPYLKVGGGGLYTHANSNLGLGSDSSWNWGYQAGGGIDFRLGPVLLGLEAKYIAVNTANLNVGDLKMEGVIATGNIGLRF